MSHLIKKAEELQPGDIIVSGRNGHYCRDVVYDVRFPSDTTVHVDVNDDTGVNVYGLGEIIRVALPHPMVHAKAQGRADRLAGATYAANPYPAGTLERMAWQKGWTDADAKARADVRQEASA